MYNKIKTKMKLKDQIQKGFLKDESRTQIMVSLPHPYISFSFNIALDDFIENTFEEFKQYCFENKLKSKNKYDLTNNKMSFYKFWVENNEKSDYGLKNIVPVSL